MSGARAFATADLCDDNEAALHRGEIQACVYANVCALMLWGYPLPGLSVDVVRMCKQCTFA